MKHPFKIKICGVTTLQDALAVADSGADAIGLNFYAKGKRYVDVDSAKQIVDALKLIPNKDAPLVLVGVFVNESIDEILGCVERLGLDVVQLHGDESPDGLSELFAQATARGLEFDVVRAIRTAPKTESALDVQGVEAEAQRWTDAGADAILVDAAANGDFGGTGKQVDWTGVARLSIEVPVILAGGLTPENVGDAIRVAEPCCVDVASGVEESPGIKCHKKVFQFVKNAGMMP